MYSHPDGPHLYILRRSPRPSGSAIYIGPALVSVNVIHHQCHLLIIPYPILSILAISLFLILIVEQGHIERTAQDKTAASYAPRPGRRVEDKLIKREREQHLRVNHVRRTTALLVLQARRERELHDEAADADGDQVDPLAEVDGQAEVDVRDCEEGHGADDDSPSYEVVHGDEWVCALADPADRGECGCGSDDADEGTCHGAETLGRCCVVGCLGTGRSSDVQRGDSVAGSTCHGRHARVVWKERGRSGDEDDSEEGDCAGDLLIAGKWLMDKD